MQCMASNVGQWMVGVYKSQIPVSDSSIQLKKPRLNYSRICTNNYTTKNYYFYNGERIINNYLVAQEASQKIYCGFILCWFFKSRADKSFTLFKMIVNVKFRFF